MSALPAVITPIEAPLPAQVDDDAQMVRLWLARSSSPNTRRNYERETRRFLSHIGESILHTLGMPEWVADNDDDYVAKSAAFASDLPRVAASRLCPSYW